MQRNLKLILIAVARGALTLLAALWIFLEEWVWDAMQACMAWLGKLPGIRWSEARIAGLPPYAAMVAVLIAAAILLPFKLLAFVRLALGHGLQGVEVLVVAQVVRTASLGAHLA